MRRKRALLHLIVLLSFVLRILPALAQPNILLKTTSAAPGIGESLTREAHHAVRRGTDWLLAQQHPDGHWSNPEYPALTALPLWALLESGCTDTQAVEKATRFLLSHVQEDGSIWREVTDGRKGGGLPNYNTAICMVALRRLDRPDLVPVILRARDYMARQQHVTGHDSYYGGFGYDPSNQRPYTDLSNSYLAFEAMKLTEDVEDLRPDGEPATDMDWEAARVFLQNCQNLPEVNRHPWVNNAPEERGGFVYHPEQTRAGITAERDGSVRFRSMPGMTYAGLLSYLYADVDRHDPRVKATLQWIRNNWNVEAATRDPEKAGTPQEREGLFYMYNVMSKGMAAAGVDVLNPDNAPPFNWRTALIEKILSLQKTASDGSGYWINDVGRYFESDPVLVTAYSMLALNYALAD